MPWRLQAGVQCKTAVQHSILVLIFLQKMFQLETFKSQLRACQLKLRVRSKIRMRKMHLCSIDYAAYCMLIEARSVDKQFNIGYAA